MKPKVVIALSIYKPNLKWLEELLISLNNQTYQNIELLVWNDCPEDKYEYNKFFSKYIKNFKFYIKYGEKNLGVNGAFEKLTQLAEGAYIAYCDQDDIWMPEKIEKMVYVIKSTKEYLVFSDVEIIDNNSNIIAKTGKGFFAQERLYGKYINFRYILMHNYIHGCTMLVNLAFAKNILPFPKNIKNEYHDWWIATYAAGLNKIKFIEIPLIKYRVHNFNESSLFKNIEDKNTYYQNRILVFKSKIDYVYERLKFIKSVDAELNKVKNYADIRVNYYKNPDVNKFLKIWRFRNYNLQATYFEILLPIIPNFVLKRFFKFLRKSSKKVS